MSLSALANGVATEEEAPMQRLLHYAEAARQLPERQCPASTRRLNAFIRSACMPCRLCFTRRSPALLG